MHKLAKPGKWSRQNHENREFKPRLNNKETQLLRSAVAVTPCFSCLKAIGDVIPRFASLLPSFLVAITFVEYRPKTPFSNKTVLNTEGVGFPCGLHTSWQTIHSRVFLAPLIREADFVAVGAVIGETFLVITSYGCRLTKMTRFAVFLPKWSRSQEDELPIYAPVAADPQARICEWIRRAPSHKVPRWPCVSFCVSLRNILPSKLSEIINHTALKFFERPFLPAKSSLLIFFFWLLQCVSWKFGGHSIAPKPISANAACAIVRNHQTRTVANAKVPIG